MKKTAVLIISLALIAGSLFFPDHLTDSGSINGNSYNRTEIKEPDANINQYERDSALDNGSIWGTLPLPKKGDTTPRNLPNPTERPPDLLLQ